MKKRFVLCLLLLDMAIAKAANLYVPSQYATIQAAINAAPANSTIHLASGVYTEKLVITNKSLIIAGAGADNCRIQFDTHKDVPSNQDFDFVISVYGSGSETVTINNVEIFAGTLDSFGSAIGMARGGVTAYSATLNITGCFINGIFPWSPSFPGTCIRVADGALNLATVELRKDAYNAQMDLGVELTNSTALINGLTHKTSQIDHIINILDKCNVTVLNSSIRASSLSWGECIRIYSNNTVKIQSNDLYRTQGGDPWKPNSVFHAGIGINGLGNTVTISYNKITGLPIGINLPSSENNKIKVENTTVENSENYAVLINNYLSNKNTVFDFGGGSLGSAGKNFFVNSFLNYHFYIQNSPSPVNSTAVVFAKNNFWTYYLAPFDLDGFIYDDKDNPSLLKIDYGTGANAKNAQLTNNVPYFILPQSQVGTLEDNGTFTLDEMAIDINDGNPDLTQKLTFILYNDNPGLFSVQPALDEFGTLTFSTAPDKNGIAKVSVQLQDDGPGNLPNVNTSYPQTFSITIVPVADAPTSANTSISTPANQMYTFKAPDFPYNDVDGDPQTGIIIIAANSFQVKNNGIGVNQSNGNLMVSDLNAGHLTFTPPANAAGPVSTVLYEVYNSSSSYSVSALYTLTLNVVLGNTGGRMASGMSGPENGEAQTTVYPNPVCSGFIVRSDEAEDGAPVLLTNVDGTCISQGRMQSGKTVFDVSFLPAGVYYIVLAEGEKTKRLKVVKE